MGNKASFNHFIFSSFFILVTLRGVFFLLENADILSLIYNKGQAWVAHKIDEAIAYGTQPETEAFLKEMKDKHHTNIGEMDKYLLQH